MYSYILSIKESSEPTGISGIASIWYEGSNDLFLKDGTGQVYKIGMGAYP